MGWKKVGEDKWILTLPRAGAVGQVEKLGADNYYGSTDYASYEFETLSEAKEAVHDRARLEKSKGLYSN